MLKINTQNKRLKPFVQSTSFYRKLKVKIKSNKQKLLGQANNQLQWVATTPTVSKVFIKFFVQRWIQLKTIENFK